MSSEQEPGGQRVGAGDAVGRLTRERDAALEAVCREQRRTVALTGLAHAVAGFNLDDAQLLPPPPHQRASGRKNHLRLASKRA